MRLVIRACVILLGSSILALGACGGDDDGDGDGGDTVDPAGSHFGYVLDALQVPSTQQEATQLGLDIDGDDRNDNALGGLLATLSGTLGLDIQGAVNTTITDGDVIILGDVQATDLVNATGVGFRVFLGGNPDPAPPGHLAGGASFTVEMDYGALVVGSIVSGQFAGGPGEVTIELSLLGNTVEVRLVGAQMQATVTQDGITSGRLAGALTKQDIDSNLMPAVLDILDGLIAVCEPAGEECCPNDSTGDQVIGFFDTDEDCAISMLELQDNALIKGSIGNPDLDLFDENNNFNPTPAGPDKESLSLGVGFTAKSAEFTAP